jgi:hypothetical protein
MSTSYLRGNSKQGLAELGRYCRTLLRDLPGLSRLLGVAWSLDGDALVTRIPLAAFEEAPPHLRDHVLDRYLGRKVCNYIGLPPAELSPSTPVRIPDHYQAEEGKIKGLWEMFEKDGIIDLRVDIQPPRAAGFTDHFGDRQYCHWQVQFGPSKVCKRSSRAKPNCDRAGAFAGVLVQTNRDFTFQQLQDAMRESFSARTLVVLGEPPRSSETKDHEHDARGPGHDNDDDDDDDDDGQGKEDDDPEDGAAPATPQHAPPAASSHMQPGPTAIFCDLDGVLADFDSGFQDLTGRNPGELSSDAVWKKIMTTSDFFARLAPYDHTQTLWQAINDASDVPPRILTGLPMVCLVPSLRSKK